MTDKAYLSTEWIDGKNEARVTSLATIKNGLRGSFLQPRVLILQIRSKWAFVNIDDKPSIFKHVKDKLSEQNLLTLSLWEIWWMPNQVALSVR